MAEVIKMKCAECGGALDVNSDRKVMCCPFCGSKNLIVESDYVKVETERIKAEHDLKEKELEHRKTEDKRLWKMMIVIGIFLIVLLICNEVFDLGY